MRDTVRPSRRRRRFAIIALLVLIVGGGLWWFTGPKIDRTLVGTWTMTGHPEYGLILRADGWFSKTQSAQSVGSNARWRTEGDLVVISYAAAHPSPFERLLSEFHYRWWRAAGGARPMGYEHLKILERAPDKLRVVSISMHGSESVMQLERASGAADQ